MFASASAIRNFDEDLFGYNEFARAIARGLVNRSNITEPYVVGIDAAWGMGKTSAANLIERAFDEIGRADPNDQRRVHVLNFSPWLFSSLDALAISYIGELTGALSASFGHRLGPDWKPFLRRLLKRFGRLVSGSAGFYANTIIPGLGKSVTNAAEALLEVSEVSTEALGRELRDKLARVDAGQIIVIVDDVDRLHPDEMRHLLTLITTFGNLPRVAHVLLHDRRIVDGAMKRSLGHGLDGGPTYLEKIVQLPAALPTVDSVLLRDFLLTRVRQSHALQQFEEDGLREIWRDTLRRLLTTPRDIARLTNSLAASWPAVADHAELLDYIGIETLRLMKPDIWEKLRDRRHMLVGEIDSTIADGAPSADSLAGTEGSPALRRLIRRLFPLTSSDSSDHRGISNRGQRAICSPNSVDVYFQFQPGNVVGRSFLDELMRGADRVQLVDRLGMITDRAQLRSVLNDLTDRLPDLPLPPTDIFRAICNAGDSLISRPISLPPAFHDVEVFRDLDELLWTALRLAPADEREAAVAGAIQSSLSIALPTIVWQRLCLRGGILGYETSTPELLVPTKAVRGLGRLLAQRLDRDRRDLRRAPLLGWILKIWKQTGVVERLPETTRELVATDLGLLNILDGLMGHGMSSSIGAYRTIQTGDRVGDMDRTQLQALAREALQRDNFPDGIADPAQIAIARAVLESYIKDEE